MGNAAAKIIGIVFLCGALSLCFYIFVPWTPKTRTDDEPEPKPTLPKAIVRRRP